MDRLLEQLATEPWGRLVLRHLTSGGIWNVYFFLLVSARLAGTIVLAPCVITSHVPLFCRAGLAIFLSLIIAPTLAASTAATTEIALVAGSSQASMPLPDSPIELCAILAKELALGTLFGIGLITVISGLRLAAEWIDRHTGLVSGSALNPELSAGTSVSGSLIPMLGIAALLLLEPIGGQSQLLKSLVQSFREIPVGSFDWTTSAVPMLNNMVQQSLILGLRVAMPLVATMTLVDVTLAIAARGAAAPISPACLTIRLATGLVVLALTLSTIPDVVANSLTAMFSN